MLRILLIDDTLVAETRLRSLVDVSAYEIIRAVTTDEALKLLTDHPDEYHVVVLDWFLGRDSCESLEFIKYCESTNLKIPVIVWSKHVVNMPEAGLSAVYAIYRKFDDDTKLAETVAKLHKES